MGKVSYKTYVDSNADVLDYSKLRVYKPSDGNKYIVCLLIANQLALAQIDSGSVALRQIFFAYKYMIF